MAGADADGQPRPGGHLGGERLRGQGQWVARVGANRLRIVRAALELPLAMLQAMVRELPSGSVTEAAELAVLASAVDGVVLELAARARDEGTVRADLTAEQVLEVLKAVVCRPGTAADDVVTTVLLDGLRPRY